ncbi:MAG: rod shape-determining protein, partial [Actinomycetota bacterium]
RELGVALGVFPASYINFQLGSAAPGPEDRDADIRGRDLVTGLPKTVRLTAEEVRFAIDEPVQAIIDSVKRCLSKAPPELAQDFLARGMYLVGGGGMLRGLAKRIARETDVPVRMSPQPLEAVVLGAGHCIENYQALRGMFMGARR